MDHAGAPQQETAIADIEPQGYGDYRFRDNLRAELYSVAATDKSVTTDL